MLVYSGRKCSNFIVRSSSRSSIVGSVAAGASARVVMAPLNFSRMGSQTGSRISLRATLKWPLCSCFVVLLLCSFVPFVFMRIIMDDCKFTAEYHGKMTNYKMSLDNT